MKRIGLAILAVAGLLAGCQQPSDVELRTEEETTVLEVLPVAVPDTMFATLSIDSAAVLPMDQMAYRGQFLVTNVVLDGGAGNIDSFALSRVMVADTVVRLSSKDVGNNGVDIGPVLLNQQFMLKVPHRISVRRAVAGDTAVTRGVEYLANLSDSYQPATQYTWNAPLASAGGFSLSVQSPQRLTVLSPIGGSVHSRERDLVVGWRGRDGKLQIIVSLYDPIRRKAHPILELRPKAEGGKALLPAAVLKQFPRGPYFVFSFILANRRVVSLSQNPAGGVLVQAASIYSSYIVLQ
jgi:hypothetical protein